MTWFIVTRGGYRPQLIQSEMVARDLDRSGWTVVRVVKTEALAGSQDGSQTPDLQD